jgi:hypothetical protein
MNRNSIATGSVAEVLFDLSNPPAKQVHSLVLERIILTDAAGRAIPAHGVSGAITVTGGEGEGEGEGKGCLGSTLAEPSARGLGHEAGNLVLFGAVALVLRAHAARKRPAANDV